MSLSSCVARIVMSSTRECLTCARNACNLYGELLLLTQPSESAAKGVRVSVR